MDAGDIDSQVQAQQDLARLAIENEIENDSIIFLINNGYSYDKKTLLMH